MKKIRQFMYEYGVSYNMRQQSNIEEFITVRDYLKDSKTRVATLKEMKKEAEAIQLDSARRAMNANISMASAYYALPDRTVNLAKINYDNLKRVIRLSKYVTANYDGDMTKIEKIGKVYTSDMSGHRYNNNLEAICKELVEAIKIEPTAKTLTIEQALVQADTMDVTVKTALLERLLKDLGYSIAEVA